MFKTMCSDVYNIRIGTSYLLVLFGFYCIITTSGWSFSGQRAVLHKLAFLFIVEDLALLIVIITGPGARCR